MATTRQDFVMHQGTHRTLRVSLTGTDPATASAALWRLARERSAGPLLEKTLADGGVAHAAAGALDIYLYPSDTAALSPGEYYHELRVIDAAGQQDVVLEGALTLKASITAA